MKLLCAADLHGIPDVYDWLLTQARDHPVDALVLAGDLLGCPDGFDSPEEAQRHDATRVERLLESIDLPVFYVMGNDDLVELGSVSPQIQSVHGSKLYCGGINFVGYQYSLPFMGGTFEKPECDIADDVSGLAALLDENTIFVSHSPAYGILDPGIGDVQIGSRSLLDLLERRPYCAHVHGHSHAGFGRSGPHFNVAAGGRRRAMILDSVTLTHRWLGDV